MVGRSHVGTMRERPLHADLKAWCAEPGDLVEHPVDGFVIDVVHVDGRGEVLIEIQTRGFSSMRRKLDHLLAAGRRVRIVYPIAVEKTILKVDDDGSVVCRRSPKRGIACDVFAELVSFPDRIEDPGLEVLVVFIREEELRSHQPGRAWRRRGWVVEERRLVEIVGTHLIGSGADLAALLPADLPDPFTTADLATALGRPRRLAQQATYCLRSIGAIAAVGTRGRSVEYRSAP